MSSRLERMKAFSEQKKAEFEAKNKLKQTQEIKATSINPTTKKKKRIF